jgi:hypothetical protein
MDVQELYTLVTNAANGFDHIEKGAVGYNRYGFVFQDYANDSDFVKFGGSKFCTFNFHRKDGMKWDTESMLKIAKYDIYLAGCLKTLVPTLKFGGDELLFDSWVFIKTPEGRKFPGSFYYRQSGTAMGGWGVNEDESYKKEFPAKFNKLINFNPFDFTKQELSNLVEAIEGALKKVPVSDYYGLYKHDLGQAIMGVKLGRPIIRELYTYEDLPEEDIRALYYSYLG